MVIKLSAFADASYVRAMIGSSGDSIRNSMELNKLSPEYPSCRIFSKKNYGDFEKWLNELLAEIER
jgi:hypothetical protein